MWKASKETAVDMADAVGKYGASRQGGKASSCPSLEIVEAFEAGWAAHEQHLRQEKWQATAEGFIQELRKIGGDVQSWHVGEDGVLHFSMVDIPPLDALKVPSLQEPAATQPDAAQAPPACDYRLSGTGDYRTRAGHQAQVRTLFEVARGVAEVNGASIQATWVPATGRCMGAVVAGTSISLKDLDIVGLLEAPKSFMVPKTGLYRLRDGAKAEIVSVSDTAHGFVIHGTGNMSARWSLATGMCLTWDNSKDVVGPWEQKD